MPQPFANRLPLRREIILHRTLVIEETPTCKIHIQGMQFVPQHQTRLDLDGVKFTDMDRDALILTLAAGRYGQAVTSLVTPNIYHMKLAASSPDFRRSLNSADLVVPDGWPVALALGLLNRTSVSRVPGVDLALDVLAYAAKQGARVSVIGGSPSANEFARLEIGRRWPSLELVGANAAPLLSTQMSEQSLQVFTQVINSGEPDIVLLCLGAPKSEMYLDSARPAVKAGSVLCVGATVDFLAGSKRRAPHVVQRLGIEWLYRLVQEPGRLWRRYASSGFAFAGVLVRSTRRSLRK